MMQTVRDNEMADDNEQHSSAMARVALVLLIVFTLPVMYALSIGPVWWAGQHGWLGDESEWLFRLFYAPLFWAAENTPLEEPLEWYVGLWVDLD